MEYRICTAEMMLNLYFCSICYVFSLSYEITIFRMKRGNYIKTTVFLNLEQ